VPWSDILGHRPLIDLLRRAAAKQRVPQSLLFAGTEGVGKHATAIALAQAVNCPNRKDGDSCGTCTTCTRIARHQHSDVTELDNGDEASIKITPLRERILDVVGYRPFEAERRVCIIDPADKLTEQAQDGLLKTLEEPPSAVILILISARPDTLVPTIQSRCRRLRFGPLEAADVAKILMATEKMDPAKARMLAAASGGSVARALAESEGEIADDRDAALGILRAAASPRSGVMPRLKAATNLTQHGSDRRDREALGARLAIVSSLLRDIEALSAGQSPKLANADLADDLAELSRGIDGRRALAAFDFIVQAQDALSRNASPKIVADWVTLHL
jgi:DNA polymerase-3 subunit delta'